VAIVVAPSVVGTVQKYAFLQDIVEQRLDQDVVGVAHWHLAAVRAGDAPALVIPRAAVEVLTAVAVRTRADFQRSATTAADRKISEQVL
jgi:hypothetical protein